jgi:hypothetical protein
MTIAFCFPAILLKSVDLPTLGRPTMATTGLACIDKYILLFPFFSKEGLGEIFVLFIPLRFRDSSTYALNFVPI